jgi:hypothetical protein
VHEQLRVMTDDARQHIKKIIGLEDRIFTMNTHYLEDVGAKILAELRARRYGTAPDQNVIEGENHQTASDGEDGKAKRLREILGQLTSMGYTGLDEASLARSHHSDVYERELKVMAEVRAYWQVAYKVRRCRDCYY